MKVAIRYPSPTFVPYTIFISSWELKNCYRQGFLTRSISKAVE